MKFAQISESDFRAYAATSPYQSFMQTPEIAGLRAKSGWTPYYLAVVDDKPASKPSKSPKPSKISPNSPKSAAKTPESSPKILAASLVVAKPTFLGKFQTFYAPGGPLLDLENRELTDFFFKQLQKFARSKNAYVLHIDPYYELIQRDRDGKVAENGENHAAALLNLDRLGFKPLKTTSMPKYLFALDFKADLKNPKTQSPKSSKTPNPPNPTPKTRTKPEQSAQKSSKSARIAPQSQPKTTADPLPTPDAVFAQFKQNTRNLIHRCERQGIKIRELTREELPILKQITAATSARRHFSDQPLSYYQNMYDLFAPKNQVKFLLAELPAPDAASTPKSATTDSTHSASTPISISENPSSAKSAPTPLSVAMFMLTGSEVVYLYSGSDAAYMKQYNAQYLIQWHMIRYALEHGFSRYNFYGIQGLPDKNSKDYGIYRFKKGFGGHVVQLIGSFELPLDPKIYRLHSSLSKLKSLLRR